MKTAIKERPILMNGDMVRATLAGRKTQTRQIWKLPRGAEWYKIGDAEQDHYIYPNAQGWWHVEESSCPYGSPGDRLWVRESYQFSTCNSSLGVIQYAADYSVRHVLAEDEGEGEWCGVGDVCSHGLFGSRKMLSAGRMPRWASRVTLEVVAVRSERLQDISNEDAVSEGIKVCNPGTPFECYWDYLSGESRTPSMFKPVDSFYTLWESIYGDGSWNLNPWVWVVEFKRVTE